MTTDPHQPQKRCGFIIPCKWITVETNLKCPVDNHNIKSCNWDTRSRPAPASTTAPDERKRMDALDRQSSAIERIESDLSGLKECIEKHDAAIARQAREQFAKALHEQLKIKYKSGIVLSYENVCDMIKVIQSQQQGGGP